ncbi:hypothetical protein C474_03025 [Halogeometricum pallidum JCM 14848]|uniref:Uncharacterized protein n=1 Tax=Halogeometricum pallidum JCM 14848 TaxID=1227487 RepID=M0DGG5_HALPD|nr:hypothetical protein [Halogeometricum pallidum]ELZ33898.1 hypothetical protein C474_03025 [Halogeometricum pallidum JCM 14848]
MAWFVSRPPRIFAGERHYAVVAAVPVVILVTSTGAEGSENRRASAPATGSSIVRRGPVPVGPVAGCDENVGPERVRRSTPKRRTT